LQLVGSLIEQLGSVSQIVVSSSDDILVPKLSEDSLTIVSSDEIEKENSCAYAKQEKCPLFIPVTKLAELSAGKRQVSQNHREQ
jgi:hypothetical protein